MRKESKLQAIQKDAQRVAEAISSSLGLETEIVDETLTIVAGTGRYRDMVGLKEEGGNPQAGYIYGRVVTGGRAETVVGAVASFRDMADVRKKAYDMIVTVQPVGIDDIWGDSPQIRGLRKTVLQVAQSNATVLISD